jgi:hypothetical protein
MKLCDLIYPGNITTDISSYWYYPLSRNKLVLAFPFHLVSGCGKGGSKYLV